MTTSSKSAVSQRVRSVPPKYHPLMDWGAAEYGNHWAAVYDRVFMRLQSETDEAVETLARLANGGRVLEFGIGTGRLALPLAARGLEVHGIDASEAMVAHLRAKQGGNAIPVVIGDFAEAEAEGRFDLVMVAFNTLFNLPTQEAQCRCFANAARHLTEDGAFVIEAFVPDMRRFDSDQTVRALDLANAHVVLEVTRHDPVAQQILSARVVIDEQTGVQILPVKLRYAWPSEIDRMAQLAGLELAERWGGWSGEPFTRERTSHVSMYQPTHLAARDRRRSHRDL
jgi:SAM-dependent methyltransferase